MILKCLLYLVQVEPYKLCSICMKAAHRSKKVALLFNEKSVDNKTKEGVAAIIISTLVDDPLRALQDFLNLKAI